MSEFNVGVIGVGDISDVYFANLSRYGDVVRVAACASRHLDRAQEKARQHGVPTAYASAEELIADPSVDIVLNLTTPDAHAELNLAAIQAGKHVYSEKPLASTFAEASRIMELAQASLGSNRSTQHRRWCDVEHGRWIQWRRWADRG